jgi:hypothetical protein
MEERPVTKREDVLVTHDPDGNERRVRVKLPPGMKLDPIKATTESKPRPAPADDPRPAFHKNVGGPYAV